MTPDEVINELEAIANAKDFVFHAYELTDSWAASNAGFEVVEPVLRFMEKYPSIDYGTPGPLVHFVERFFGKGYEAELLESIKRNPTPHTVGMLNRLINGMKSHEQELPHNAGGAWLASRSREH